MKGQRGILKTQASRAASLADARHRIRFVCTPKQTSWLNQIERWFSVSVRELLRRSSFASSDDLQERLLRFINYFNHTMAKPIQWLYSPQPA